MAEIVVQRQPGAYNARDLAAFVATCSDDVALYRAKSGTPLASGKRALAEFHEKSRFGR
ncbi:MAG: hypothetical protein IPH90_06035 [Thermomonas sp.]|nr:hypothetical protein [Thermomonas sp.]